MTEEEFLKRKEAADTHDEEAAEVNIDFFLELVSKELNHLAAILHVYAGGLNFMK